MSARERILERVRAATQGRERSGHPGDFEGWRPKPPTGSPLETLSTMLQAAGAEVVTREGAVNAGNWVRRFANDFDSVSVGVSVPREFRPMMTTRGSHEAALGISMARAAIAETGSLVLDARDGRRTQLLPPTHVVLIRAADVRATFREVLRSLRDDLPSAVGLHSGPSKSADIAQTLVQGVHGPGRLVAVIIT